MLARTIKFKGSEMNRWYAVQTKSRQEQIARENLARQDFHVHLPLIRMAKRRRGRWQTVTEALFPGYLFVELDLLTQNAAPIRSTRGVLSLVRCGVTPLPVPPALMEQLLVASDGDEALIDADSFIKPGDRVELVEGPMAGLTAIVQEKTSEKRVLLLLDLLGRKNKVVVDIQQLVPAH